MSTLTSSQSIVRDPIGRSLSSRSLVVAVVETERKIQKDIETDHMYEIVRGRSSGQLLHATRRSPPLVARNMTTRRSVSPREIKTARMSLTV